MANVVTRDVRVKFEIYILLLIIAMTDKAHVCPANRCILSVIGRRQSCWFTNSLVMDPGFHPRLVGCNQIRVQTLVILKLNLYLVKIQQISADIWIIISDDA